MMSKSFEPVQKHAINLELELQQCKEKIKNDMSFKINKSKDFCKEREQYFEIQDLKAQLQDKCIVISELKKLIEKLKGKYVETKFEKSSVIRQPNAFKSQRPSILGKPTTFSNSFVRKDFSKSTPVTQTHVSNDFSKPVIAQILPVNKKSILKNTNVLNPGIYKIHTDHTQSRTSKLPPDSRKTNKRVTFSTGVIPSTSVSRPQLKNNPMEDRVLRNNITTESNKKPRNFTRKIYEHVSKTCSWWYPKSTPSGYIWEPKSRTENVNPNLVEIVLFIVDFGCSKHMTRNLKLLINFVEKFMGTVKFGNDQIVPILGYGDLIQGAITIKRVYYVEGLNHNLFSVGQFYDADLEVAFRKSTCFIRDLKENNLLSGSHGTDLYSITFQDIISPNPISLVAKATSSQAWLWHRRLLSPANQRQANVTQADRTVTTSNELDLLFSPMFDELLNGSSKVVSKSSVVSAVDAPIQRLETELSKSKMMSKSFEPVQKHAINLELELQQCKEKIKNDMSFKINKSKDFCKEREQYFEIQDLKAQLQDKCIVISELKKLIEKLKGKYVETKFEKSSVIRQPNAFKSQRPSILGKPTTFSNSFVRKDFSKSTPVTQTHVSNDFSKPVIAQILPVNKKSILKNTNVLNPGIYKIHTDHTQSRTSKLPPDSRKTNKRVTFSTGEVEDHRRNVKLPKNETSVTACNDSLNAKTLNVKSVSMCDKCVLHDKHDMCVPTSVTKPIKRTVTTESNKKPRNFTRKIYEHVSKTCSWWYPKSTPSGYIWEPKSRTENVNPNLVEIVLFIVDFGCSKHMTRNLKLLINFVEKFMGTVKFGNDQIVPILGYGDLIQGAITIKRVYYVEGLNHNLFSVGQFYDADLEVAFRKSTCFIRDLKENNLLSGSHGTDLYSITFQDIISPNPISLVAKATSSQAWLWHRRLSHLNFNTINLLSKNDIVVGLPKVKFVNDHLCSSCELGKAKRKDGENLDKMKEKCDECIFMGYSTQSKAYRVFNKSDHGIYSLSPANQRQANVTQADRTVTTSNELDLLFSPMFDELLNGSSKVVSKSSVVSAVDAPIQRQQYTTPLNNHTKPAPTC
nr:integrase, catalytic region, zinc finger, CCHC-type, peptidase aspartic, catalytic [Tanacetum cinerariifolium]